jgi:hypothetical protein
MNIVVGNPLYLNTFRGNLVKYCIEMDNRHFGLRRKAMKHVALLLAIRNDVQHPFSLQRKAEEEKLF